jgi:hypothetical protein
MQGGFGRPALHATFAVACVDYRLRPEPGPVGESVDPLADGLGASVLPDGFRVLFDGLFTEPLCIPVPAVLPVVPVDGELGEAVVAPLPIPPPDEPPPAEPPV